jgi:hypothetical protein
VSRVDWANDARTQSFLPKLTPKTALLNQRWRRRGIEPLGRLLSRAAALNVKPGAQPPPRVVLV